VELLGEGHCIVLPSLAAPDSRYWSVTLEELDIAEAPEWLTDFAQEKPDEPLLDGNCEAANDARIMNTEGFKWLAANVFMQGMRNNSFFALGASLRMAGYKYDEAWWFLTKWRHQNTKPIYSETQAEIALKCIYQHSYGLSAQRLFAITTRYGKRMGESVVDSLIQAMPRGRKNRVTTRENVSGALTAIKIIDALKAHEIIDPQPISATKMAEWVGISPQAVERVAKFLSYLEIRSVKRLGRSNIGYYGLKDAPYKTHDTIIKGFDEWMENGRKCNTVSATIQHINDGL
jgi:hypothetical protein